MEQLRGVARTATSKLSQAPRRQPSNYPFPVTYIIGFFFFVSSAIVTGITGYFIYYLRQDSMSVPYQFIFLIAASSGALLSSIGSTYAHLTGNSKPKISLIISTVLLFTWIAALGLITSKISPMVLQHSCSVATWRTDMGVMVCRIYKALYSFLVIGTASILATAILDAMVLREVTSRGAYREMKDQNAQASGAGGGKGQGLARSMSSVSGMAARRAGFGLRGADYLELKESPDLDGGDGDMGRLMGRSPDLRFDGQSPDLSEYERTPKL